MEHKDSVNEILKKQNKKIASIILSAGYSSRMQSFKPFLRFGKFTAIEIVINTHINAGIDDIIVVTGYRGNEIMDNLKNTKVKCVQNENYSEGMFTSVVCGLKQVDNEIKAFFIQPVDIPLVKKHTLNALENEYFKCNKGIIYPNFCGQKGHPPLIDSKYKKLILESDGSGGLIKILENFKEDSINMTVFDEAVLKDMDTKEDYKDLLNYYSKMEL
jgi:CTP:molybdopterin cytidylyltransferase MocA